MAAAVGASAIVGGTWTGEGSCCPQPSSTEDPSEGAEAGWRRTGGGPHDRTNTIASRSSSHCCESRFKAAKIYCNWGDESGLDTNTIASRSSWFSAARTSHCCESRFKAAKIYCIWGDESGVEGGNGNCTSLGEADAGADKPIGTRSGGPRLLSDARSLAVERRSLGGTWPAAIEDAEADKQTGTRSGGPRELEASA